jgi:two-component system chemotaxis response regulator CheY
MSKRIIVIDDSKSIRELVAMILENEGYLVDKGVDGPDGLRLFDGRGVNLVITDLNMPGMDGISLVREVRKMDNYRSTPIVLLTTELQASRKEEAKVAGANGWIVKPFDNEKLLAVVNKLVK